MIREQDKFTTSKITKIHFELVKSMDVFKSNGSPENFINNCFKAFLGSKHRIQENVITVPKKPWFLASPSLPWTIIIAN